MPAPIPRRQLLRWPLALALPAALSACGRKKPALTRLPAGSAVLALGDSLTWGTGAAPETSYPAVLQGLTGWRIANAGVPGDTSAGALARLPGLLQEGAPQLVLVSIGGNDFLRRLPESDTRRHIQAICEQIRASGAQTLLIAVPALSMRAALGSPADHPLYADLARSLRLPPVCRRLEPHPRPLRMAQRRRPPQRHRLRPLRPRPGRLGPPKRPAVSPAPGGLSTVFS